MIDVTIEADPEGLQSLRTRLQYAGVADPTRVPVANLLRVVADMLDKKADFVEAERPVFLGENDSLTFRLTVMP